MIEVKSLEQLEEAVARCISLDWKLLESLREEIREHLKSKVKQIREYTATSISLVATDGGENQLRFDPFLIQLIRVVDSASNEYFLEVISPTTPIEELDKRHLPSDGEPQTALGKMMKTLGVKSLSELSPMIRPNKEGKPVSPTWVQVYREIVEWAVLFSLLEKDFASDVLIVRDGLLRSKVFAKNYFINLIDKISERLKSYSQQKKRNIYIVGVAKKSKVLLRYRLAMALEGILRTDGPAYVEVPRGIEEKVYEWPEYARGDDNIMEGKEANKYVGGNMFLVKFGPHPHDPIWPVDILSSQIEQADKILGYLRKDAVYGFPIPYYPLCLQKAHENAALAGFDFDIVQDYIYKVIRNKLDNEAKILDSFQLQDSNPAQKRYQ